LRMVVNKAVEVMIENFQFVALNETFIPLVLSLQAQFTGLYEIYCIDNAEFLDIILTFG
jgi:hypothetical protein